MSAKAQRLAESGAVRYLPNARVYPTTGDSGDVHMVILDGPRGWCPCGRRGTCEHIRGARLTRESGYPAAKRVALR